MCESPKAVSNEQIPGFISVRYRLGDSFARGQGDDEGLRPHDEEPGMSATPANYFHLTSRSPHC
jgi:hypothetical protein